MNRECRNCEFYDRQRRPDAGRLSVPQPFCVGLGFFLMGNHAPECDLYRPRPGVTVKRLGGGR